ncbi:MAG: hypothetical protein AAF744_16155 [Pseudomonadota bacterium]
MKSLLAALVILLAGVTARAQDWGNLDQLLMGNLTRTGTAQATYWLPDSADPAQARRAVGVAYEYIEGSAGSFSIAVGVFIRQGSAWGFVGTVNGVFGQSPRDVAFAGNTAQLTTTTLRDGEPRCCPTGQTRWQIDLSTLTAQPLP